MDGGFSEFLAFACTTFVGISAAVMISVGKPRR